MKLTKKQEQEARKVYEKYWDSYMKGDLKGFSSTLDEAFEMIGTSENEVCHSKADGIKFYKAQMKEMVGKAAMRNRRISVKPVNGMFLFNEIADIYILGKPKWTFYARIRISTLLHETRSGWKVIQQHGSFPDMRVQEGETIAFEKISKENLELRDAVKRATVELETKNRNLKTEAALERVRAVAMGMKKSGDLLAVCKTGFRELKKLGFVDLRNMIIHTYVDEQKYFNDYDYSDALGGAIAKVPYTGNPVIEKFIRTIRKGKSAFSEIKITGKQLEDWKKFRKANKEPVDPRLNKAKALYYYIYSVGSGSIGISTFSPIDDEKRNILIRFRNVFDLSYQRYLDIQKAEAQAREAQIEASLERVRASSMGMHKSSDLLTVINLLADQFQTLGLKIHTANFNTSHKEKDWDLWLYFPGEQVLPDKIHVPYIDHPYFNRTLKVVAKGGDFSSFVFTKEEKDSFLDHIYANTPLKNVSEERKKFTYDAPGFAWSAAHLKNAVITVANYDAEPYTEEQNSIIRRFGKVFDQAYTRFLDLQKAEAQAREAQIEVSLERVRSKTMAMHNSNDVGETVATMFGEFITLGIHTNRCGVLIFIDDNSSEVWTARPNPDGKTTLIIGKLYLDTHPLLRSVHKAWKANNSFYRYDLLGDEVARYYDAINRSKTYRSRFDMSSLPSQEIHCDYFFAEGAVFTFSAEPIAEEHSSIIKRFAAVFGQTYRRYLDLQKAETQAREAQIEAALEKVRSRSLAMHKSDELREVVHTVIERLAGLNIEVYTTIIITFTEGSKDIVWWLENKMNDQFPRILLKYADNPYLKDVFEARNNGMELLSKCYAGQEKNKLYEYLFDHTDLRHTAEKQKEFLFGNEFATIAVAFAKNTAIHVTSYSKRSFSEEETDILKRFAKVFDQAYTRFLDLQKAEAQAREAQIEAALERIRSKVTAMQESSELLDIVVSMRSEFVALSHEAGYFWYMRWLPDKYEKAMTSGDGSRIGMVMTLPRHIHGDIKLVADWEKSDEPALVFPMDTDMAVDYVDKMITLGDFQQVDPQAPTLDDIRHIGGLTFIMARTTHGEIGYSLAGVVPNPPEEDVNTLVRFAAVFDLAYRRFEDLKEAERRNRETQIELALERVRSRTMAMHKSAELKEVIKVVLEQFVHLNINVGHAGFYIDYKANEDMHIWLADPNLEPFYATFPYFDTPTWNSFRDAKAKGKNIFTDLLDFEEKNKFYQSLFKLFTVPEDTKKFYLECKGLAVSTVLLDNVGLYIENFDAVPYSEEENKILMRFGKVFQQTYTRFLDLQKAEAQAREAQIEAALEKVRSRSLAMQQPNELTEVAELLRKEMGHLGVEELETSSIYIVNKENEQAECWYAIKDIRQENKSLVSDEMTITFDDTWVGSEMGRFYRGKKEQISIVMKGDKRKEWINYCAGKSKVLQGYYGDEIPERTYHLVKFNGGYMGAASPGDISTESWDLLRRAASVFSLAYTRFNDLKIAEAHAMQAEKDLVAIKEAKQKAEEALGELQATQKQLIQSEKMASLGELTAGIAHEIQNPLNFVNNFSEVSKELLDEMKEELEKGNVDDAREIMNDVIQNLEKINHHGKRADGIVKGMLQHSRSSSGQKELTDINALCDEYLRLAYHGLRAKDKNFNAKFEASFDETIGKINILPQDLGRVVLNLINNAFYAVSERLRQAQSGSHYEPTVTVSTQKAGNVVEIKVRDNGTGIPQKALDKIFQPFFTTKPTGQGTGLGLSLSYDIVTKGHGGELKVETKEGEGTTFIVVLPV